jgi:chromosome segregation ATPase
MSDANSDTELVQILKEIKNLKAELFTTKNELEQSRQLNGQLHSDLEKHLDTEFSEQVRELNLENEAIASERDHLTEKITGLEKDVVNAKQENIMLKRRIAELESSRTFPTEVQSVFDSIRKALKE